MLQIQELHCMGFSHKSAFLYISHKPHRYVAYQKNRSSDPRPGNTYSYPVSVSYTHLELKYTLETYQEHALERSSTSKAIAYVGIRKPDGTLAWGAGVDPDIIRASIDALVTAINNR